MLKEGQLVIGIIVARGGSVEVPRKNIAMLGDKPLIQHTIAHALSASLVDEVVVSTDDEEIAEVARAGGALVPFLRPAYLGRGEVMWKMILQHALCHLEDKMDWKVDIVVALSPTFPFRDDTLIDCSVGKLLNNRALDGCLTMVVNHNNPWIYKDGRYVNLVSDIIESRPRKDRQPVYDCCYGLGSSIRSHIVREGKHLSNIHNVDIVVPEDPICSIDINTQLDFDIAKHIHAIRSVSVSNKPDLLEGID